MSKGPFEYSGGATGGGDVTSVFGRTGDVVAENGDYTASQVTNVPAGNIAATDVQAAINELDTEKAPTFTVGVSLDLAAAVLTRAALTGDVTAAAGSNATTIATNAVTNAKMANMAANTVKGNGTGGSAAPQDLTFDATLTNPTTSTVGRAAITGPVAVAAGSNTSTMTANSTALAALVNAAAQYDLIGRKTASGGAWEDCTRTQLNVAGTDLANVFTAANTFNVSGAAGPTAVANQTIRVVGADSTAGRIGIDTFASGATFDGRAAEGTASAPSATAINRNLVSFNGFGYGSTGYVSGSKAQLNLSAAENWTDTANGTSFTVELTPIGSTSRAAVAKLTGGGGLTLNGAADIGLGTIRATGAVRVGQFTVGTLPAAATVGAGAEAFVTDSAAAPVFSVAAVGGGSLGIPVTSDGTTWRNG